MKTKKVRKIILCHKRAPGDTVVLTALVRDISLALPGQFQIGVDTSAKDLWRHNPYVDHSLHDKQKKGLRGIEYVKMVYGKGIRDQNYEPVHFMPYFYRDFERQCKVKVPLTLPYPDLHLSQEERDVPLVEGRYWVIVAGGKSDFTAKVWSAPRFQEVADNLIGMGLGVVQVGGNDTGHWHPPLKGVVNLVGHTNLRDLIRLIYHSEGVICGVTCLMHIAAALQRPCVCLAGGREAWWWEAYVRENKALAPVQDKLTVPHQFLHTIGLLDCCKEHGCWKNKVIPLRNDRSICYHPVMHPGQPIPRCLDMITTDHVMEAVMKYYVDRSLPPINQKACAIQKPASVPPDTIVVPAKPPAKPPAAPPRERAMLSLFDVPEAAAAVPAAKPSPNGKANGVHTKAAFTVAVPPGEDPQEFLKKVRINPRAKLEGRGPNHDPSLVAHMPGAPHPAVVAQDPAVFDHEDVGGKFTTFVLFYGPDKYFDLHQRCLNSLIGSVPRGRMDLRVGSNALNKKSVALIDGYVDQGVITKHYRHKNNDYKYPVMREMFRDPQLPIETKWVLWFDDDSICDRTPAWLNILAQQIIQFHRRDNAHMFGAPFIWTFKRGQKEWYASRPWYHDKPWRLHNGRPSPSGNKIIFCAGGFWAITHEAICKCDIPDTDIGHNGGDVTIGEQLYQGGYRMKSFNGKKQFIFTSSVPRRGVTMPMPGTVGNPKVTMV